jgi:outer membrane protein
MTDSSSPVLRSPLRSRTFAAACLFCLSMTAGSAFAQPVKIGYVDPFRIENESAQAQQAIAEIKREFDARDKQLKDQERQIVEQQQALQKAGPSLKDAERGQRERELTQRIQRFEQARAGFMEDFEAKRREALAIVIRDANVVIRQIAENQKFDLIFQQAVYFSKQIDITDQVLKGMADRSKKK